MIEPRFLSVEQVQRLHRKLIELFGGTHGLRDPGLCESAVIHPRNAYYYGHGDLFDVAAAYAFHIAQAQAFLDGNKRTGVAAALTFLDENGVIVPESTEQFYEAMIAVAEGRMNKTQLAALLRLVTGGA